MKLTIESTPTIVDLNGASARLWQGRSDTGVPVTAYVTALAVPEGRPPQDYDEFERDCLRVIERPSSPLQDAILAHAVAMELTGEQVADQLAQLLAAVIATFAEDPPAALRWADATGDKLPWLVESKVGEAQKDRLQ
ncbi:hypothetical protein STVA_41760 [Allostella vacuolata]|nr:hypothetical protein STVA_41760 [Stella vacuolata]